MKFIQDIEGSYINVAHIVEVVTLPQEDYDRYYLQAILSDGDDRELAINFNCECEAKAYFKMLLDEAIG